MKRSLAVTADKRIAFACLVCMCYGVIPDSIRAETWSLSQDFSVTENDLDSTWSYRLDDGDGETPNFPLLATSDRDANELWGSDFATPPMMWSGPSGYWGIGRNSTAGTLFSSRNDTNWPAGEILLHPGAGSTPNGLVICWKAPGEMVVDVRFIIATASPHSNGVGYSIFHRGPDGDTEIVALEKVGESITNELNGIRVEMEDRVFFPFSHKRRSHWRHHARADQHYQPRFGHSPVGRASPRWCDHCRRKQVLVQRNVA